MHTNSIITSLVLLFLGAVTQIAAQYPDIQSAPFNLIVYSTDPSINGSGLLACHEGAAIEGLCTFALTDPTDQFNVYTHNLSYGTNTTDPPAIGLPGVLVWVLETTGYNTSYPMSFSINSASNVALPLFGLDASTTVAFDENDYLNIQSYLDDTVVPVAESVKAYYRWVVCETYWEAYYYTTLAWVLGDGVPQNPSCVAVDVKRVWV